MKMAVQHNLQKSHSHKEYLKDPSSVPFYLISLWPLWVSYVEKMGYPFKDMQLILKITSSFQPISGSLNNQVECITKLENCIDAVRHWMQTNFLKLNENKMEFIILGLPQQLKKVGNITITTGEDIIQNVSAVKNPGMFLDAELKHMIHINKLTSSSFNTLHNISRGRCHLDQETTNILVQALILSKFDYCNSLLLGIPKYNIAKLQRIQNMSCRMIYQLPKHSNINTYPAQLHWFKIQE